MNANEDNAHKYKQWEKPHNHHHSKNRKNRRSFRISLSLSLSIFLEWLIKIKLNNILTFIGSFSST